ncbi:MAG: rhamnan synthesis F family protein [Methylocella sp.]
MPSNSEARISRSQHPDVPPEANFCPEFYLAAYPDVAASGMNPYQHYVKHGRAEGRLAQMPEVDGRSEAKFCPEFYLAAYPDVAASGMNPYQHYVKHGRSEGRLGHMPGMDALTRFGSMVGTRETVLIVSHNGARGGAPILSYNLVRGLQEKYNVLVIFLGPGPILDACHAAGAVVVGPIPITESTSLADLVVRRISDAAVIKFAVINSIESRHVLPALAKRYVPTISLIHEFAAYIRPHGAFREAVLWSGQVVFSSEITRDNALTEYPDLGGRDYPVIPQGRCIVPEVEWLEDPASRGEDARIQRVLRPEGFPADGAVILGAGSVEFRKGVDLFIDCAARVLRLAPDLQCRFVWIGRGYDPDGDVAYSVYLADQIRRSGLDKYVFFLNEVSDLAAVYEKADLFVLSSRLDPLPNVAIDALATGLPVICFSKTTGIADILNENGLGTHTVADYLDTADMARKLIALVQSKDLRIEVAEQSSRIAGTKFNMQKYIAQIEQLAVRHAEYSIQEKLDAETIAKSDLPRLDYYLSPTQQNQTRDEVIRTYVRSWGSGVSRRKLFPGFHPGIYVEQHGIVAPSINPVADYLRAGRPKGPWNFELITPSEQPNPIPSNVRIALHIHAYYPDIFLEMLDRLKQNRVRPDLLISVTSDDARKKIQEQVSTYKGGEVRIHVVPNRGRDIGPLLTEFGETLKEYELIGHLHTKKTVDVKDASVGKNWYRFLLENLVGGNAPMADIILSEMLANPKIGMVFPDDPHVIGWDKNKKFVIQYCAAFSLRDFPDNMNSPVGTMFWARSKAIKTLLDFNLDWADYPSEPVPYDGSLLHGLERLFGLAVQQAGFCLSNTNIMGVTR